MLTVQSVVLCQSPQKMSYQAIIRNGSGQLVSNKNIGIKISIVQSTMDGPAVYIETQSPTTNNNGQISIEIAGSSATVSFGKFDSIEWKNGPYFIKTEIDPLGGTNYTIIGINQLLSVPYALHAASAETITGAITETDPLFNASPAKNITADDIKKIESDADGSTTNEIQALSISNDTIFLSNGGFVKLPSSSSFNGSFNDLKDVPTNLDTDKTDDFDGTFSSLAGVPAGLDDGDDNTQLSEAQVDAYVANNGYLTSEVDGSTSNEIQALSISNDTIFLSNGGEVKLPPFSTFSGSFNDLKDVPTNLDTDKTDDFDGTFSSLAGVPAGLDDGDDNTQLSEAQVDAYVANNGYLTSEVDGSTTNEIQALSISNDTIFLSNGGFVKLPSAPSFSGSFKDLKDVPTNLDTDKTDDFDGVFASLLGIPAGLDDGDDDTQLSEAEVDAYVANNGYLTSEVDGSVTNEIELPSQSGNSGKFLATNGSSPSWATINSASVGLGKVENTALSTWTGSSNISTLGTITTGIWQGSLSSGKIYVGNGSGTATETIMTGDLSLANDGTATIQDNSVDGTDIELGSDATGDIMYYDGTNWVRLPKGTDGQILTLSSGVPSWADASSGNKVVKTSTDYTVQATDGTLISNAGSTITFTLPNAATAGEGKTLYFYSLTNSINISTSETIYDINGSAQTTISTFIATLVSDGTNSWYLIYTH